MTHRIELDHGVTWPRWLVTEEKPQCVVIAGDFSMAYHHGGLVFMDPANNRQVLVPWRWVRMWETQGADIPEMVP